MPQFEKQPRQHLHVAKSLWDNLEFIQVGFHIGRYISVAADTEADRENIKALYANMETTSPHIKASA
jgi:hypothetical protein